MRPVPEFCENNVMESVHEATIDTTITSTTLGTEVEAKAVRYEEM